MKKLYTIFLIFIFFPLPLISNEIQNKENLTGFLDISWGANIDTVEKIMGGYSFIKYSVSRDDLRVYSGTFAEKENANINIHFFNNRFYGATIAYYYKRDEIAKHYQHFVSYFSRNYGDPDIGASDNNAYSKWDFANGASIYISISGDYIYIGYENRIMNDEIVNWQKENPEQVEIMRQEIRKSQIEYFATRAFFYHQYYNMPGTDKSDQESSLNELYKEAEQLFELTDQQIDAIRNNQLYIGMHYALVFLVWGRPAERIKTVDIQGEHIKYVYEQGLWKYKYAYTDNDFLTSWQE